MLSVGGTGVCGHFRADHGLAPWLVIMFIAWNTRFSECDTISPDTPPVVGELDISGLAGKTGVALNMQLS